MHLGETIRVSGYPTKRGNLILEMENHGIWVFRVKMRGRPPFTYLTDDEEVIEDTYQQMQRVDIDRLERYLRRYGRVPNFSWYLRAAR
jgi:hypothetical protein